jgi:putative peptidoglycan lipid II flippase
MAAVLWITTGTVSEWLSASASERVLRLTWVIVCGAATYFMTLWVLGFRLRDFYQKAAE